MGRPRKQDGSNGSLDLGGVALNSYVIELEDGTGNALGAIFYDSELDIAEVTALFEGLEPLSLAINNEYTDGKDIDLDGFSKPLHVVSIEKG